MALKYLTNLNINDNVLQNARVFAAGTAPTALLGALYVDTADSNKLKYHNGSSFIALGTSNATGDITAVTAGNGLTGGGDTGDVELTVGAGDGITVNPADVAVTATQTTITSIFNSNLKIGHGDSHANIDFSTDNSIIFDIDGTTQVELQNNSFFPTTTNDVKLGTNSKKWAAVNATSFNGALTGNVTNSC